MPELLAILIYLWTRDLKVPIEEMHHYVSGRVPAVQPPLVEDIFSDPDRIAEARKLAKELMLGWG